MRQNSDMIDNRLPSHVADNRAAHGLGCAEAEPVDLPEIDLWDGYVDIGPPTSTCVKCGARMWNMEWNNKSNKNSSPTFSLCCKNGQVQLPPEKQPPEPLRSLIYGSDRTIHFKLNHRPYNSLFAMYYSGGKIDHKINNGGAPYCFTVKGQNLHLLGSMLPADGESPKYCNQFHTARGRFKDNDHDEFRLVLLSSQSESGRPNIIGPTDEVGGLIYVVDAFCAIEQYRLDWVTTHQTTIRSDLYTSIRDSLRKGNHDPNYVWKAVVLPESFTEFQKWGLPHMHMLIWLHPDSSTKTVAQIDALVSAEIPDKDTDPVGYATVSNYMIHGPCGVDNTYSPCMVKGRCTRHFPKRFNGNTYIDDCGFPIYGRRNTGRSIKKRCFLDNRLPIHLPGNKYVSFRTGTRLSEVVQQADSKRTKFEAWFKANKEFPAAQDFTYAEFPTHFTWLPRDCKWRPHQRGDVVVRLTKVHATGGDFLYLRMLLMRKKGCTSFDELRTVEGHVFESFKETCAVMGLLQNDS
ncbi:uncharacterized protein LOC141701557 [Apium graveolens]|uniref:uncharacterized protein LOC141701557 n=1 Tax=Apium graveolens TaxID=4045 RepID=UPI003D79B742